MIERLKAFASYCNSKGIPILYLRDPKTGNASVSLTMLFISFNIVLFGLIGKFSHILDIDLTNALTFFGINSALYFGRKVSGSGQTIEEKDK